MKRITWKRWEEIQQEASEKANELPRGHVRKKEALYHVTIRKLISKEEDAAINYLDGIGVIAIENKNLGTKKWPHVIAAAEYIHTSSNNSPYHETPKMLVSKYGRIAKDNVIAVVFEEE